MVVTDSLDEDPRSRRRAARRAASTADILDAAERVFSEDGLRDGSLRRIAELSGYSTAAIYKFFDSKHHLVTETLNRRADEYLVEVKTAATAKALRWSACISSSTPRPPTSALTNSSVRWSVRSKAERPSSAQCSPPSPTTSTAATGRRWR